MEATVSTKGQVVIPKEIRDRLRLTAGSRVEIEDRGDSIVLRPVQAKPAYTIDDLLALPKHYTGPARSIEEMNAALDADLRARWKQK